MSTTDLVSMVFVIVDSVSKVFALSLVAVADDVEGPRLSIVAARGRG